MTTENVVEEALCVASPRYLAVIFFVAASANLAEHDVLPPDRAWKHSLRVPNQNATRPVGVLPYDFTVADSFTAASVKAVFGLADAVTVDACLVAAPAGSANIAQAATAMAVTDSVRTTPAPARCPSAGSGLLATPGGRFSLMPDFSSVHPAVM
jgi:hypothetical protein